MKYRPDIDGLRTLAVLPVVLYHAEFFGLDGGFVGVDLFFVISGYLITSIIYRESLEGRFTFANFYERRLRRILPALLAVLTFVSVGSWLYLLPSELRGTPASLVGTVFFVANIVLWRQSGYFETAAEENPLLHMWSLGVEEQFYIFAPIALLFIVKFSASLLRPILLTFAILSFFASAYFSALYPGASFYLLPTRAWEIAAGSLIAVGVISPPKSARVNEVLSASGIALIFGGFTYIDDSFVFPGSIAAIPVFGAMLVILSGKDTFVGRILGAPQVSSIGLISYSLYLWHWPLIVFGKDAGIIDGTFSKIAVVLLSIAVAWISWRFIECPFRSRVRFSRKHVFFLYTIGVTAISGISCVLYLGDGWQGRFPERVARFDSSRSDVSPERARCHFSKGVSAISDSCVLGGDDTTVVVWGDSHGVEFSYALSEIMPVRQITYSACPPAINLAPVDRPDCAEHNELTLEYLINRDHGIEKVFLSARFDKYMDNPEFRSDFSEVVDRLSDSGLIVVIVAQAPRLGEDIPSHLARGGAETFPVKAFAETHTEMMTYLEQLQSSAIVDPSDFSCDATVCRLVVGGAPALFDSNHPTLTYARGLVSAFADKL